MVEIGRDNTLVGNTTGLVEKAKRVDPQQADSRGEGHGRSYRSRSPSHRVIPFAVEDNLMLSRPVCAFNPERSKPCWVLADSVFWQKKTATHIVDYTFTNRLPWPTR